MVCERLGHVDVVSLSPWLYQHAHRATDEGQGMDAGFSAVC